MKNIKLFINNAEEIIPTVNDSPYKRILVIGDVHAAFDKLTSLWKKLSKKNLSDKFVVDSAGCNTYGGEHLSKGARKMLIKYHIPFGAHVSKPFDEQEYRKFKCVIALDEEMLRLAKQKSGGDPDNKIRLFKDLNGHELNIDDPFHTNDYEKAYAAIKLGCVALLTELLKSNQID